MNEYYTYAYLREDGTPYYVGKGTGRRSYVKHGLHTVPPKERILILKNNLTETDAFKHEVYMIAVFGRKDIKSGILHNRSEGGAGGNTGYFGTKRHKENCKKRTGENNSFYGRKHSSETLQAMKESLKGRSAWNKGKYLPEEQVSAHALYMREWRKKRQS